MYYLNSVLTWTPRNIGLVASFSTFLVILFNKSEWKIRFLDWGAGLFVVAVMSLFFLLRGKIKKTEFLVLALPLLWMGYALIVTPFSYLPMYHLYHLFEVFVLNMIASFLIIALFTRESLASKTILALFISWIAISFVLLALWSFGLLEYAKRDFAGLFGNRNDFALQTSILLSLFLFFVRADFFIRLFAIVLSFILIGASLSIKSYFLFFYFVFFPTFLRSNFEKKIFVIMFGILAIGFSYALTDGFRSRVDRFAMNIHSPERLRKAESAFLRPWLIIEGTKLAIKNPVTGVGVNNAKFFLIPPHMEARGRDSGLYTHNNYLEILLSAGIVGFFLFYIPLVVIYFQTNKLHPYWIEIKTFSSAYILIGTTMVQYDHFISIFLYCLILFLYLFYKKDVSYYVGKNSSEVRQRVV